VLEQAERGARRVGDDAERTHGELGARNDHCPAEGLCLVEGRADILDGGVGQSVRRRLGLRNPEDAAASAVPALMVVWGC
jgi:hypothetical protein